MKEAVVAWEDRIPVPMPVQRPPVTLEKMLEGPKASVELTMKVEWLSSWELSFTPEALKRLARLREVYAMDWKAATLGMSRHR